MPINNFEMIARFRKQKHVILKTKLIDWSNFDKKLKTIAENIN